MSKKLQYNSSASPSLPLSSWFKFKLVELIAYNYENTKRAVIVNNKLFLPLILLQKLILPLPLLNKLILPFKN